MPALRESMVIPQSAAEKYVSTASPSLDPGHRKRITTGAGRTSLPSSLTTRNRPVCRLATDAAPTKYKLRRPDADLSGYFQVVTTPSGMFPYRTLRWRF